MNELPSLQRLEWVHICCRIRLFLLMKMDLLWMGLHINNKVFTITVLEYNVTKLRLRDSINDCAVALDCVTLFGLMITVRWYVSIRTPTAGGGQRITVQAKTSWTPYHLELHDQQVG